MAALVADLDQIACFFAAVFRHATPGTYVSVRGFRHRDDRPMMYPFPRPRHFFPSVRIGDPSLVDKLGKVATWMAQHEDGIVFCPPLVTLVSSRHARAVDTAEGFTLSVECDDHPAESRKGIETLLGTATVVVASGGEWTDPESGEVEPKLHLHYRLSRPTREPAEHQMLLRARDLACRMIDADWSGGPIVHPYRWPGSWHRKDPANPRLAVIVAQTEYEIELDDAVEILRDALDGKRTPTVDDFGADAGRGMEGITRDELPTARPIEHWQLLARGVKTGSTARVDAIMSIFGHMLRLGMEPELAISLARAYNAKYCDPSLDDEQVDNALDSILKREFGE